ncbi:gustatory receptor 68a-like [Cydia amplana]|uniref:gustatory receptor 68a-like n=1 Tax=Cydia amplana TaxID=1869771 RepID=UPI002FE58545
MIATLRKYFSPVHYTDEQLNFLQILKPLYILLSFLGLFPQGIQFSDGTQNITKTSKISINLACSFLTIVTTHVFFILHLLELNASSKENTMTEDYVTEMTYTICLVLQMFVCTVSYFCAIRDRNMYIIMLNSMADYWNALAKGQKRQILGRLRVKVNCVVLGAMLVLFHLLSVVTYTGTSDIWKNILISLTFNLLELIQWAVIAFYFVMILMVVALLQNIEEEFRVISDPRNLRFVSVKAYLGHDIVFLRDMYVRTMDIKRQVNAAFQAQILVALAMTFHELVSTGHLVYHGLSYQSDFTPHDVAECCCWVLNQFVKLYILGQSGSLLKSQVNRIGRIIHNIPSGHQDFEVYLMVQHFSTLMTYQEATLTIYGYFSLDASLLFNIVVSAVMYLVIMVQFDRPE